MLKYIKDYNYLFVEGNEFMRNDLFSIQKSLDILDKVKSKLMEFDCGTDKFESALVTILNNQKTEYIHGVIVYALQKPLKTYGNKAAELKPVRNVVGFIVPGSVINNHTFKSQNSQTVMSLLNSKLIEEDVNLQDLNRPKTFRYKEFYRFSISQTNDIKKQGYNTKETVRAQKSFGFESDTVSRMIRFYKICGINSKNNSIDIQESPIKLEELVKSLLGHESNEVIKTLSITDLCDNHEVGSADRKQSKSLDNLLSEIEKELSNEKPKKSRKKSKKSDIDDIDSQQKGVDKDTDNSWIYNNIPDDCNVEGELPIQLQHWVKDGKIYVEIDGLEDREIQIEKSDNIKGNTILFNVDKDTIHIKISSSCNTIVIRNKRKS